MPDNRSLSDRNNPTDDERARINARYAGKLAAQRDEARALVRRAAPFVNAAAVMAENKAPALAWLADSARAFDEEDRNG
jgi:phage host-nuclease inhibitor protein Gam